MRKEFGQCTVGDCDNDAEWVLVVSIGNGEKYRSIECCDDCAEIVSHRHNVIDGHRWE